MVEVLDGATLEPLSTFKTLVPLSGLSSRLTVASQSGFTRRSSPIGTSRRVAESVLPTSNHTNGINSGASHLSIPWTGGAAVYKVGSKFRPTETWFISTYNLITGTHGYSHEISEGCIAPSIWTCGDHFRFVTVRPGSITLWQAGFTSIYTLAEVESLPVTNDICRSGEFLFLPTLSRLAFDLEGKVLVWDATNSRLLLNFVCGDSPTEISFSSDGRFSARQDAKEDICIWRDSPTDYVLHQKLVPHVDRFLRPHLSTNGECITLHDHSTIRLWPTESPTLSVSTALTDLPGPILEFSPDKSLAAVAQQDRRVVRVLDLTSGDPRLMVDTGTMIVGLRMAESTVAVVGQERVVSWNLPRRDASCVVRRIGDNVQTTVLDRPQDLTKYFQASISPDLNSIALMRTSSSGACVW